MSVGEQASEQVMTWASISVHVFVQRSIWQKYRKTGFDGKTKEFHISTDFSFPGEQIVVQS